MLPDDRPQQRNVSFAMGQGFALLAPLALLLDSRGIGVRLRRQRERVRHQTRALEAMR